MTSSDEDQGRSRRLGTDDWKWSSTGRVLSGRTIEGSSDTVCDLHRAHGDEERGFLSLASKPRSTVSRGLTSKSVVTVVMICPQNHSLRFPSLGLKTGSFGLVI
jgi:hypothetical protein